jgi:hypothetical protein
VITSISEVLDLGLTLLGHIASVRLASFARFPFRAHAGFRFVIRERVQCRLVLVERMQRRLSIIAAIVTHLFICTSSYSYIINFL